MCKKYIPRVESLSRKFNKCTENNKGLIINYVPSGKGVILYEMVKTLDSYNTSSQNEEFLLPHHFFCDFKGNIISQEDYESVNNFRKMIKFENLGELNKIYNFQDTIILCKIFEQCSDKLQKLFKYTPRKCNYASSFSGCSQRDQSKCFI